MCPDQIPHCPSVRALATAAQRGFSIVSAIFLLVVLATLGAFMVTFSTVQHTTSAHGRARRASLPGGARRNRVGNVPGVARRTSCVGSQSY